MFDIHIARWPFIEWKRRMQLSQSIGWMALTVSIVAASTYNTFAKSLADVLSPLSFLFLSELLTAMFVVLSFGIVPLLKRISRLSRTTLFWLLVVGLLNSCIAPMMFFFGLRYTTAVNASLFGSSEMLFLLLFAVLFLHEEWNKAHLWAAACTVFGILVVVLQGFSSSVHVQLGDLLILLASATFAVGSIVFRHRLHTIEPQIMIFFRSCVAVAVFFLVSPFLTHPFIAEMQALPLALIPALLGFAFFSRFLNLFGFYISIERLSVATVSLFSSFAVIIAPMIAHLALGEPLLWYHYAGGGFIVLGTVLLEFIGVHPTEEHLERHLEQKAHHRF